MINISRQHEEDDVADYLEILACIKFFLSQIGIFCAEVEKGKRWLVIIACNMCQKVKIFLIIKDDDDERPPLVALDRIVFDIVQG